MPSFDLFAAQDPELFGLSQEENERQRSGLELIPSENHVSEAVLEALATRFSDKYAEGYPGRRYYAGNAVADKLETAVQERAKKLFGVPYVNVQPYSGSPANFAVYFATCEPGDTFMGLDLLEGGHLTHGWKHSATAKFWKSVPYHLTPDGAFDFEEIAALARQEKPKLIWCGGTAVARTIPFERFASIADEVGALLVADISHIAGLIAGGAHPSPIPHVHLVTTTTHKTLRGPRGAMIMVTQKGLDRDPELPKKIDKAIIPGLQGGPHLHTITAIGAALNEAASQKFSQYTKRVVENAKTLAETLAQHGFTLVSGGTDNHLILIDLRPNGIGRGKFFQLALERVGLYANMNTVPKDSSSALYPSGLRLGTPAATTRGMGEEEMKRIASWINEIAKLLEAYSLPTDKAEREAVFKKLHDDLQSNPAYEKLRAEVAELCQRFPVPSRTV